jgi:hypothetical protein
MLLEPLWTSLFFPFEKCFEYIFRVIDCFDYILLFSPTMFDISSCSCWQCQSQCYSYVSSFWNVPYLSKFFFYHTFTHLYPHGTHKINDEIFNHYIYLANRVNFNHLSLPLPRLIILQNLLYTYPVWTYSPLPGWYIFWRSAFTLIWLIN